MGQAFWQQEWFIWGALLIVVFPLTTVILGEIIYWLRSRHKTLVATILILRNLILPSLAVFILLNKILGLSADKTPLRIVQTILWVCTMIGGGLGTRYRRNLFG